MKHYKKRTIALVLASVVTVVGAFGAENYKNSLMSLKFESGTNGAVNMTLHTKRDYTRTINPIKKDATTYVIMLPETNSQMSENPEIFGNVESVDIKTMPYTTNSKGYTKITVKTTPNVLLSAKKVIYIPEKTSTDTPPSATSVPQTSAEQAFTEAATNLNLNQHQKIDTIHSVTGVDQTKPVDIKKSVHQFEPSAPVESTKTDILDKSSSSVPIQNQQPPANSNEILLLILGALLVITTCAYLFIKGKNKMAEILGEQSDFEIDEKPQKQEKPKSKKIKKTINKLDKMYTKPVKMPVDFKSEVVSSDTEIKAEQEEATVVDLDELFQEKTTQEISKEEELALEDFLSAFSFMDDEEQNYNKEDQIGYDEELYEKFINDKELKFSDGDIEKINKLLNTEINDETIKNINQYLVTNPIEKKPSRVEILENFVTSYTINQNITFTKGDVEALYKLISVEIDNDFITDLRTNPEKINQIQREILTQKSKPHKTSEILTLKVKDMLPDLSDALRKQGGKEIKSDFKPGIVYYSDGYEVETLTVNNDELPDLSIEINNESAYITRPSDKYDIVEEGYEYEKMEISNELPDLADVIKNPEKYEDKKDDPIFVDEQALLDNIADVTFKPFDDGTREFEIINKFDEEKENAEKSTAAEILPQVETESNIGENIANKPIRNVSEDLIKSIEKRRRERDEAFKKQKEAEKVQIVEEATVNQNERPRTCSVDGEEFKILSSNTFNENMGCYLGKNMQGYCVIGYIGDKLVKLKRYETLKTEKLESRLSEKLKNGKNRYIVRLGVHKFILNVSDNDMEFVMDLC